MKIPEHVPDHTDLGLEGEFAAQKTMPMPPKVSSGEDRPPWGKETKRAVWRRMVEMRLAFEHSGSEYARCYMCLGPGQMGEFQVDHFHAWSALLAKLRYDAADEKRRQAYPGKGKDFFIQQNGGWVPTAWAGIYYSNDLTNLILIHGGGAYPCNQSKSNAPAHVAVLRNVYSRYGNLAKSLEQWKYPAMLEEAERDEDPVRRFRDRLQQSAAVWNLLHLMNAQETEILAELTRRVSMQAGLVAAVSPADADMTWAPDARLPGSGRKPTDVQRAAMRQGSRLADPRSRPRMFRDDMDVGDLSLSPRMADRLRQLPRPKPPATLKRTRDDEDEAGPPAEKPPRLELRPPDHVPDPPIGFVPPPPGSPPLLPIGRK